MPPQKRKILKVDVKDIDEWNPKDFCHYIQHCLELQGHTYQFQIPKDLIIIGSLLNLFKRQDKTKETFKQFIDTALDTAQLGQVKSLAFVKLAAMDAMNLRKKKKVTKKRRSETKLAKTAPPLSDEMKEWLKDLKDAGDR